MEDKCRKGADYHRWHVYLVKVGGDVQIKINKEGQNEEWLNLSDVNKNKSALPVRTLIENYKEKLLG